MRSADGLFASAVFPSHASGQPCARCEFHAAPGRGIVSADAATTPRPTRPLLGRARTRGVDCCGRWRVPEPSPGGHGMATTKSIVTPERFASGRTFEQYLGYIGTAENLKREGSGGAPRRDWSAAIRAWYDASHLTDAQAAAI